MITMGIDPGVSGAIAFMENGYFLSVHDMPLIKEGNKNQVDPYALARIIRSRKVTSANVEKVSAMPGQGVTSMFNFGRSYGVILGTLGAMNIYTNLIRPVEWKNKFDLIKKEKDASRILAQELFPLAPLKRKKDHGRADAMLIGLF